VYVWVDGTKHSWLKVRSSVVRLVKRAFRQEGITMPDEAREVIFPEGVPVRLLRRNDGSRPARPEQPASGQEPRLRPVPPSEERTVATDGEGGLGSDAEHMGRMADGARTPEEGPDLLGQNPPVE
jgi:hypothetical protein